MKNTNIKMNLKSSDAKVIKDFVNCGMKFNPYMNETNSDEYLSLLNFYNQLDNDNRIISIEINGDMLISLIRGLDYLLDISDALKLKYDVVDVDFLVSGILIQLYECLS